MLKCRDIIFSTVIFPNYKLSLQTKFQDWETWAQNRYLNAVTPLILTADDELAKFKKQREQKQLLSEISPELLNRKMKLPNGEEIAAEKYLKEIVLPYIPTNGLITLNNGNEIPVSHFLMECVIFDCQQKYNGDFAKYMKECVKLDNNVLSQDDSTKAK